MYIISCLGLLCSVNCPLLFIFVILMRWLGSSYLITESECVRMLLSLYYQDWISTVAGKQAAFHGLAEYYQSGAACSNKSYGEEIARLQHAKELTQAAMTRGGKEVDFSNQLNKIDRVSTRPVFSVVLQEARSIQGHPMYSIFLVALGRMLTNHCFPLARGGGLVTKCDVYGKSVCSVCIYCWYCDVT